MWPLNLFDLIAFTVFFLVQWRIAVLLRRRFPNPIARTTVLGFDLLLAAGSLCTLSDLMSRLGVPGRPAMVAGAITLTYFITSTGVLILYMVWTRVRNAVDSGTDPVRRRLLNATGGVLMAAPFAVMGYGALIQRTAFGVKEIDIPLAGLNPDLDGLRILQLSDIHLSAFLSEAELERVIDACAGIRANVIVVTGDLISTRHDPLDACIRQIARLRSDAGTFGCMGNHERYAHAEAYTEQAAARAGILFLRGTNRQLRFGSAVLNLAGVDYQSLAGKKQYLRGADRLVVPGAANILLSHNPDVFPVAARQGYNLVLAGHTHGGQVNIEILDQSINPARFITPFVRGLYRLGDSAEYVTRGIGTIAIPARVGAPPEISVIRLRKA